MISDGINFRRVEKTTNTYIPTKKAPTYIYIKNTFVNVCDGLELNTTNNSRDILFFQSTSHISTNKEKYENIKIQ